ncbi:hypothetical protein C486_06011 [Natrinema gari JCM 14663]|uniref:Uncharacterized protein n=1 Tax=Natrinema gari JCM 14663 TaxID=1230459 RepID=L9Z606_9EURY|nr:hypothetical protein C486_06011 [Natrinema gari JCM 14663]
MPFLVVSDYIKRLLESGTFYIQISKPSSILVIWCIFFVEVLQISLSPFCSHNFIKFAIQILKEIICKCFRGKEISAGKSRFLQMINFISLPRTKFYSSVRSNVFWGRSIFEPSKC